MTSEPNKCKGLNGLCQKTPAFRRYYRGDYIGDYCDDCAGYEAESRNPLQRSSLVKVDKTVESAKVLFRGTDYV